MALIFLVADMPILTDLQPHVVSFWNHQPNRRSKYRKFQGHLKHLHIGCFSIPAFDWPPKDPKSISPSTCAPQNVNVQMVLHYHLQSSLKQTFRGAQEGFSVGEWLLGVWVPHQLITLIYIYCDIYIKWHLCLYLVCVAQLHLHWLPTNLFNSWAAHPTTSFQLSSHCHSIMVPELFHYHLDVNPVYIPINVANPRSPSTIYSRA